MKKTALRILAFIVITGTFVFTLDPQLFQASLITDESFQEKIETLPYSAGTLPSEPFFDIYTNRDFSKDPLNSSKELILKNIAYTMAYGGKDNWLFTTFFQTLQKASETEKEEITHLFISFLHELPINDPVFQEFSSLYFWFGKEDLFLQKTAIAFLLGENIEQELTAYLTFKNTEFQKGILPSTSEITLLHKFQKHFSLSKNMHGSALSFEEIPLWSFLQQ
jgi:hypothetical protein